MYDLWENDPELNRYLPSWGVGKKGKQPEKQFVWSVIHTLRPFTARRILLEAR